MLIQKHECNNGVVANYGVQNKEVTVKTLIVKGVYRNGIVMPKIPIIRQENEEAIVFFPGNKDFGLRPDKDYEKELKTIYPEISSNYGRVMERIIEEGDNAKG